MVNRFGGGVFFRALTQSRSEAKNLLLSNRKFKNFKVISKHFQHSCWLRVMNQLLGYMLRPLSGYFQAFKIFKIKITIATIFL
jgi:hypothetical protein